MIIAQKRPASRAVRRSYTMIQNEKFSFENLDYIRPEILNFRKVASRSTRLLSVNSTPKDFQKAYEGEI